MNIPLRFISICALLALMTVLALILSFVGLRYVGHQYSRWNAEQELKTYEFTELSSIRIKEIEGKKSLAEADWNRRIQIADAKSKQEAAKYLAQVEIERAKGVAEANKIIGDSLKGNDGYLRYLWIQGLQAQSNTTIYVPTEAGLPILEAARFNKEVAK
jgi:hypothetical protein